MSAGLPNRTALTAAAVLVFLPLQGLAQQAEEPVVVTATRTAETADESLSAVTVIDREEIERSQAQTVPELLEGRPGLDFAKSGGPGQVTSLFTRGTESDQTLVLIDGVRMGSVSSGGPSLEFLPVSQIERIEIVRGPRSTLYGSEAMGGVIQIFTRDGGGGKPALRSASVGGGSDSTVRTHLSASGGERTRYAVTVERFRTAGVDAREPTMQFGSLLDEPDDDGFDNSSASVRVSHDFGDLGSIQAHGLQASGNTEFDASSMAANETEFAQQSLGADLTLRPTRNWQTRLSAGSSRDDRTLFRAGTPGARSRFDSQRIDITWQNDVTLAAGHMLTVGLDYQEDRLDSSVDFEEDSRFSRAAFAQYQGRLGPVDLLGGVRRLDNEQFGDRWTGNGALGLDLPAGLRWTASFGTAFKAPTFNDLFFPGFNNPDLDPEESRSWETAFTGTHAGVDWELRGFRNEIDDLIVFDSATLRPENVEDATINGLEAQAATGFRDWRVDFSLTVLDAENDTTGNRLPRRAEQTGRLAVDRQIGRGNVGLTVLVQGGRFDDPENDIKLDGYATADLRAGYELVPGLSLQGRVENALDQDFQTVDTFNQQGRKFFVTLRYGNGRS